MAEKPTTEQPKSVLAKREEELLAFWQENKIFEKSLEKESPKGNFVFYDGPPFATGLPHYGHILASAIKDAVPRYQTMKGFRVDRKWGWDCHGLPIENIVEKELKVSGKKEIEAIGVEVFNEKARSMVLNYVHEWKRTVERIARWVDFDGSYKTMDNSYMESVWWALKKIHEDDGLIYESTKVLPYCPRCETPIANSEIAMDNSYKDITDISVYVKFKLTDEDAYMLAWTTTPWTLPGNTALAINKDIVYAKAKKDGVTYILAKELAEKVLKTDFEILSLVKGEDLVGKSYEPVFDYYKDIPLPNKEYIWKIWHADFVTLDKGTGIAHEAPAFGEEDMFLAQEHDIPLIKHVGLDGRFTKEVTDLVGKLIKPKPTKEEPALHQSADVEIIKKLAHQGSLFAKEKIIHSYPHCFRCETPLYYYAIPAWFIEIQSLKNKLAENNEKINWIPEHLKEGRFKKSMEGAPDWNISRNRFWATPLPFWKCQACGKLEVLGSVADIKKKTKRNSYFVMRHGESQGNQKGVISSIVVNEDHLTSVGEGQVTQTAHDLKGKKIDMIFVSPFVRTKETAAILSKELGLSEAEIIEDARLGELQADAFNGKTWKDYYDNFSSFTNRFNEKVGEGENYSEAKERVMDFLYDIDTKYQDKTILVISHGLPLEMMLFGTEGGLNEHTEEWRTNTKWMLDNGEVRELDFASIPHTKKYELDLHRPYIDSIVWKCDCGGEVKRTPEVIDCWFESGSMPFAQKHYPFQNEDWFTKNFPAQFVAEYIAQTRTWFYYMHVVSTILFDTNPFENVVTTGTVLAEDGQKMSKLKGNFPDPWILFDKYGVDAIRLYLLSSPIMKSEDLNFSEKGVEEVYKKILQRLNNVVSFYEMYADENSKADVKSKNVLDQWILARLNQLGTEVTESMEKYELDKATRPFADFVDDLSTWYLRRSRDRFKGDDEKDKQAALSTTRYVLLEFSKLVAPFMPFIAEDVYQKVKGTEGKESVHLEEWPKVVSEKSDELLKQMAEVRHIVSLGLEARMKVNIKVRQPLVELRVRDDSSGIGDLADFMALIKDEINVKEVILGASIDGEVELDTVITPELKAEGQMRELLRAIQEMRKEEGLQMEDRVTLVVEVNKEGEALIKKFETAISKPAGLIGISFETVGAPEIEIDELTFKLKVVK